MNISILIFLKLLIRINTATMKYDFCVQHPKPPTTKPVSNYVSTTKYNILTFLPKALANQFRRYANIYFLLCAVLQSISVISPLQPFSAVAPLVFVLSLSLLREGYEDYKRWDSDETVNSYFTHSLNAAQPTQIKWKEVNQGDFIKIRKDETIPADCLILICSSPSGISYVETSSLDGEKNLKPKFSNSTLQTDYNESSKLPSFERMSAQAHCINPTYQIQSFEGVIELKYDDLTVSEPINKKNMMLRGCKLKNTDWAIGMVIYTGLNTAIMMNSSTPFTKISKIENKVNSVIIALLGFQLLCNFISSGYCYYHCKIMYNFQIFVTKSNPNCIEVAAISFGSYFILYSSFIPISLIVSLEFVKVFQGYFMSTDRQMFCSLNKKALECRTVSINEQLGQIQYILTDKTGTLTCNKMQFRNIIVGDQIYGQNLTLASLQNINYEQMSNRYTVVPREDYNFDSRRLTYDMQNREQNQQKDEGKRMIELIFVMITTCHQCVSSSNGGFEGPSPDEVALLKAAEKVGFKFLSTQNKTIRIQYQNRVRVFEQLKMIEFDSDRKRMTVVLRSELNIYVFVKGADTSITKLLAKNQKYYDQIREKTEEMSRTGLRSLWFAYKIMPSNVDIKNMSETDIESQLTLIGATGIQDKLQDFVAETIFSLRSGGIKFIMLTGDKLETAQNIARSCRLIEEGYLIKNKKDLKDFVDYIDQAENSNQAIQKSPVIDGSALSFFQNEFYLEMAITKVNSAVFCRVTPGQKAEIVKLVKNMGKITLAIGDGANDVNMIMQANVGVGIFGQQGTRAAQVANYAIGQFCLLWKLLLFYGRLNYIRVSQMILYFFYKNMVFTSIQLAYCFYSLGSGQSFWLSWSITLFNMVFTFFPVVLRAVFEVDIELQPSKETFHQLSQGIHNKQLLYSYYPKMYHISQKNRIFTNKHFIAWLVLGIIQGTACLVLTLYSFGDSTSSSGENSYGIGFYLVQISAYTTIIIVVTIKLAVNVKHWTLLLVFGFLVTSLGAYVLFTFVSQVVESSISYRDMIDLLSTPMFYIVQFICIGTMFCFDFFLFSLEATKNTFQNYLKNKILKSQRLSESNLNQYMLEMTQMQRIEEENL